MVKHNPFGDRCKIVEITALDDFTSEGGYNKVVKALQSPNVVIFASLPCTGGSPWQIPNSKHPACRRLINKHHKLFNRLFNQLVRLYGEFSCSGTIPILFEWPRVCRYWRKPKVANFIKRHRLQLAKFDGCAYGLRSCIKGEEDKYLKKPWMIATSIPEIMTTLDGNYCPGTGPGHEHSITRGKNAKHSQQYTNKLATAIHKAIADFHVRGIGCWSGSGLNS